MTSNLKLKKKKLLYLKQAGAGLLSSHYRPGHPLFLSPFYNFYIFFLLFIIIMLYYSIM